MVFLAVVLFHIPALTSRVTWSVTGDGGMSVRLISGLAVPGGGCKGKCATNYEK